MILHIISIGSISPGGLMFTLASVIGSLVYLHVIVTWLWVCKLKIGDIFSFLHQSTPHRWQIDNTLLFRLSSSIQRSLLLMCFSFLCHLTGEEGETLSIAILTRLSTNSRNSIAINKNWDFQVRMTSKLFNVFDLQLGGIVDDNPFKPPSMEQNRFSYPAIEQSWRYLC